MRHALSACYVCFAVGSLFVAAGFGQDPVRPEFEVASVKVSAVDPARFSQQLDPGEVRVGDRVYGDHAEFVYDTLRQLIVVAYKVLPFQVAGPDWLDAGRFDVFCKMPAGSRREDVPLMLQSLLEERFKLIVHRQLREENISALVVAKGGPKLKESPPEEPQDASGKEESSKPEGQLAPGKKATSSLTVGTVDYRLMMDQANCSVHMEGSRMTMAGLAVRLTKLDFGNGRPVVDMTGLTGAYDVILDIPFAAFGHQMVCATGRSAPNANDRVPEPAEGASDPGSQVVHSLKNLGLELESRKAPVEQLIVDHAERIPTAN